MSRIRVEFRCYEEEKAAIRERAVQHGLSVSEYLRRLVVAEQHQTQISTIYPQHHQGSL
jgi:hypothetical protein